MLNIGKFLNNHGQRNPYQISNACINFCVSIEHYHFAIHCKCIWTLWRWRKTQSTSCKTRPIIKVILSKNQVLKWLGNVNFWHLMAIPVTSNKTERVLVEMISLDILRHLLTLIFLHFGLIPPTFPPTFLLGWFNKNHIN